MSIKNLPGNPRLKTFFWISLFVHVAVLWSVSVLGPELGWLYSLPSIREPVIVEVVELPPGYQAPQESKKPEKPPARYADRTSVVEKETFPETGRGKSLSSKPAPVASAPRTSGPAPEARSGGAKGKSAGEGTGAEKSSSGVPVSGAAEVKAAEAGANSGEGPGDAEPHGAAGEALRRPNLLLTEEKITELAKKYESEPPSGEKGKTLRLNTSELKYQKYLVDLKNRIERYWEYPVLAVKNGWQGKLTIDFTIGRDGRIEGMKLARSSNYPVLDDAAITALKLASPFAPFPEDFDIEDIKIHGMFEYNMIFDPMVR